jgi:hypothetical protein
MAVLVLLRHGESAWNARDVPPEPGYAHVTRSIMTRGAQSRPRAHAGEVGLVKKSLVLASTAAVVAVGVTLLMGKDDIRRFLRMHSM